MHNTTHSSLLDTAPVASDRLLDWVGDVADLTRPDRIHWVDGSEAEYRDAHRRTGCSRHLGPPRPGASSPTPLPPSPTPTTSPGSRSGPSSAPNMNGTPGFTNNWMDPAQMKEKLRGLFDGAMRGRTMYVIPFVMGHLDAEDPKFGVEVTDSAYVVASMRIMAHTGSDVLAGWSSWTRTSSRRCIPSAHRWNRASRMSAGPATTRNGSSTSRRRSPIWSYGSGYGGNALLGKKCYSLRIASAMSRQEGWLAEHMLILKLTSPEQKAYYISAAFPSACGKTNLALLNPTVDGWKVETLGDDIAWIRWARTGNCGPPTRRRASSASRPAPDGTPTPTRWTPSPRATPSSPTSPSPTTGASGGKG